MNFHNFDKCIIGMILWSFSEDLEFQSLLRCYFTIEKVEEKIQVFPQEIILTSHRKHLIKVSFLFFLY